jgi:hypothetical protein
VIKLAGSIQYHEKIIEKPNQPNQNKNLPKKSMFSASKLKNSPNFMFFTQQSLQAQPKIIKKTSKKLSK